MDNYKLLAHDMINALVELERFIGFIVNQGGEHHYNASRDGNYPFIPLNTRHFVDNLYKVKEYGIRTKKPHPTQFVDFGCGVGTKLMVATHMGYESKGYELYDHYIKLAEQFRFPKCNIEQRDLLDPWTKFSHPIVAYYYCPIAESESQIVFEHMIEDALLPGSYLIACLKKDHNIGKDERFAYVHHDVWYKHKD
jgi:hypothetical protein